MCAREEESEERGAVVGFPSCLCVGYEKGAVRQCDEQDERFGVPFIANGNKMSWCVPFLDDLTVLTIGNELDPSVSVFHAQTGRCLVRRIEFEPTCLFRVPPQSSRGQSEEVCPSEDAVIIGGEESQLKIYRVVALSPNRIRVRREGSASEGVIGVNPVIGQVSYRVRRLS